MTTDSVSRPRTLVSRAFTPARVEGLRPRVRAVTDGPLESMAWHETADLIGDFAHPLSLSLISELIRVPVEDRDDFRAWTTAALTPPSAKGPAMPREEGAVDCVRT